MTQKVDIVPIKEACRLWQRDARTLKKWALEGILLYDIIGGKSDRSQWYIETPTGRQNRVFNN
jgi:hypothetical protein